jgi:hypothetical protein
MSRLTGKEVYSLMEAYQQVYAPQELTEEQVWEEVEIWVHSLLEEGYDLSDYTWEEMYETYLSEGPYDAANVQRVQQVAQDAQTKRDAANATLKGQRRSQDVADYKKAMLPPKTSQQTGMDGRYSPGSSQVRPNPNDFKYKSTSDGKNYKNYNDALAANRSRNAPRPTTPAPSSVTPTPAAPAPGTRPGAPAPGAKPDAAKTLPTKPMGGDPMDQWARANPTLAAKVKPGQSGYNTIRTRLDADNDRQENYDAYDLVLSHLINEGYADTEEAALTIMSNMSEDWRESIVEEVFDEARKADKLGYERGTAANPNIRNISHSDPSQRTMLNSKVRRRADEMGRERRNSPKYKQGARPPLSAKEKSFLKFADRSSPTSGNPRNPNVQDTGSQTTWPSERRAQKDPKQNPKHNANRDNDK